MKLVWIAAALCPEDVVPHPNVRDSKSYSEQPHVALAAALYGAVEWRAPLDLMLEKPYEQLSLEQRAVWAVVEAQQSTSVRAGVAKLESILRQHGLDPAAHVAITLLAVAAAAELEEIDLCEELLLIGLSRIREDDTSDSRLLKILLLQQTALRRRDFNRDWKSVCSDVIAGCRELLASSDFSAFQLRPMSSRSSDGTVRDIVVSLQRSSWSLAPSLMFDQLNDSASLKHLPSIEERVSSPRSEHFLTVEEGSSKQYSRYIAEMFSERFRTPSVTLGRAEPELFQSTLQYELYGSGSVYAARKELALYRLLRWHSDMHPSFLDDCLRLLRDSNSDSELALAVDAVKQRGPLDALSDDARKILVHRCSRDLLRPVELVVLRAAADLLTTSEASFAFGRVVDFIQAGSPLNVFGRFASHSARLERPLLAAVHLANHGQKENEFSTFLIDFLGNSESDELIDLYVARALRALNWSSLRDGVVSQWTDWARSEGGDWKDARAVVRIKSDKPAKDDSEPVAISTLTDLADYLNDVIRGHELNDDVFYVGVPLVRGELASVRRQAQAGAYSAGGPIAAELAALLIDQGASELWSDLIPFLLDSQVSRGDRSSAFERLALRPLAMPESVRSMLADSAEALLNSVGVNPFEQATVKPYPEALRFLSMWEIIPDSLIFMSVNQLAGSGNPLYRTEAARTVAVLAAKVRTQWLITLAIQLSYDSDVETRAFAGNALAKLHAASFNSGEFDFLSARVLVELLTADGVLVPLMVVRGFGPHAHLTGEVRDAIWRVATEHASSRVRREARELLPT